jgi:hypothetical protein
MKCFCVLSVEPVTTNLLRPLIAADGYFFCLETKEAKIQVTSRLLLCRTGPSLQSRVAPQAAYLLRLRALCLRFCKI